MKKYFCFLIFFITFFLSDVAFAQIPQLWVDKTELYADDVLTVYIKLTGNADKTLVDISPFYAHFDVISFNRIPNNPKYNYTVKMVPKKFGATMMPSLNINGYKTSRILLKRYEQSLKKNILNSVGKAPDIFLKVKILDHNMYVFGKGKIQLCLYDGIGIIDGKVDDPRVKGGFVTLLTQNPDRVENVNHRSYLVKSWDYQVSFDTPSLVYVVDQVRFKGTINGPIIEGKPNFNNASPFQGVTFAPPRDVTIYSESISLPVKALPKHTFPARGIVMSESYEMADTLKINDSVKRNIVVYAIGGSMNVDAEIESVENPQSFSLYPSQISKRLIKYRGEPTVEIKRSFVYVMNRDGRIEVPEIVFNWFNIENGLRDDVKLSSKVFFVQPDTNVTTNNSQLKTNALLYQQPMPVSGINASSFQMPNIPNQSLLGNGQTAQSSSNGVTLVNNINAQLVAATASLQTPEKTTEENKRDDIVTVFGTEILEKTLYQIAAAFLLLCLLISSYLHRLDVVYPKFKKKIVRKKTKKEVRDSSLNGFYEAARMGDAKKAEVCLIKFADMADPEGAPHNLMSVGLLFGGNHALMSEIEILNRGLYSGDDGTWNGSNLILLINRFYKLVELKISAKREKNAKKDEVLPSLYMN